MKTEASEEMPDTMSTRGSVAGANRMTRGHPGTVATLGNAALMAVDTILVNKLRSGLTILGIVIGIAAVVLVGAAIEGLREYAVATTAQTFGSNTFIISQIASTGTLTRKELADKQRRNPEIYRREADALAVALNETARMSPTLRSVADVKAGNKSFLAASVTGSGARLETIKDIRLSQGRFFTEEENRKARGVVVIGQDLVEELFPSTDPIGKQVRIGGQPFIVIGVQERQGSSFGASQDRYVWIPLLSYEKIWGSRKTVTIFAQPKEAAAYEESMEESRMAFRAMRRLRPGNPDNFDLLVPEAGRSFVGRLTGMIAVAIVPISSVALFVAGIVVMNMMLVSVTERIREIGVRKSLGARRKDILAQIILESTLLAASGGGLGLLISYLGAFGLARAFGSPIHVAPEYAVLAIGLACTVGIAAGVYPAYLAAGLQPVDALRSET